MKRFLSIALMLMLAMTAFAGSAETDATAVAPKYIFLFIGDGMSTPQVQAANYYLNAANAPEGDILKAETELSFMKFPVVGSVQTYDSSSFCPDSASTVTSIASGHKTYSGVINMDESLTVPYETIAEKLKAQLGYKIGVISSVNLNHATPAGFYAHQASRSNYYEIGQELVASNFDFFAGGGLLKLEGKEGGLTNIYDLAKEAGYTVTTTQADAEAYTDANGKVIMIDEHLADSDSMPYAIDLTDGEWTLADYVTKGIALMSEGNDKGFFMMVEGGKIDWACHANDAASSIKEVVNLSDSIDAAMTFYNAHPDETLIIVTGDHETGGLTIGFAGTNYATFLNNLSSQKISYAKFDSDYVSKYIENNTSFEDVLADVEALFGLKAAAAGEAPEDAGTLTMTDYELSELQSAYDRTMSGASSAQADMTQEEYEIYGSYEPLTVTITHLLNNKSGVAFTTYSHSGLPAAVYAIGAGAADFGGYYDNTEIYTKLAAITGVN